MNKEVLKITESQELPPCYNMQAVLKLNIGIYLIVTWAGGETIAEQNAFLRFCRGLKITLEDVYIHGLP